LRLNEAHYDADALAVLVDPILKNLPNFGVAGKLSRLGSFRAGRSCEEKAKQRTAECHVASLPTPLCEWQQINAAAFMNQRYQWAGY
jgi:hypothetical protein